MIETYTCSNKQFFPWRTPTYPALGSKKCGRRNAARLTDRAVKQSSWQFSRHHFYHPSSTVKCLRVVGATLIVPFYVHSTVYNVLN